MRSFSQEILEISKGLALWIKVIVWNFVEIKKINALTGIAVTNRRLFVERVKFQWIYLGWYGIQLSNDLGCFVEFLIFDISKMNIRINKLTICKTCTTRIMITSSKDILTSKNAKLPMNTDTTDQTEDYDLLHRHPPVIYRGLLSD